MHTTQAKKNGLYIAIYPAVLRLKKLKTKEVSLLLHTEIFLGSMRYSQPNPYRQNSSYSTNKGKILKIAIVIVGVIFAIRLFDLQILDTSYRISASNNVLRFITDYPARGLIYDRNGELLVYNEVHFDIMVVPGQVKNLDTAQFIAMLGIDMETFLTRMQAARAHSRFRPSMFVSQISKETFAGFQEKLFNFPGFYAQPRNLRRYPHPIAAHTLGYIGEVSPTEIARNPYYQKGDYIGISGIERAYEESLRGRKGVRIRMVDVLNRDIGPFEEGRYDTLSIPGKDLFSTLDVELQRYGEQLLRNFRGSIVAIEPSSGEILALVSSPAYDPNLLVGRARAENFNLLQNDPLKPLFNRALMAQYPPGSAFKVVNTLIALQENIVEPHSRISCGGAYTSGRVTVRCRNHPGPVDVISSLQYSCNTYSVITFRRTLDQESYPTIQAGLENWHNHVRSFGFGVRLNTDLAHELSGQVPTSAMYDRIYGSRGWSSLTVVSLSIGQGEIGSTPLQLANLAATVANRGYFFTPHVIRAIGHPDSLQNRFRQRHLTTVDREHFDLVAQALYKAVTAGTGAFSVIPGIPMAGKTGTVQNPHGENHSVFIAFAPVDNPKIAISVIVENAGYGSVWAAPIASLMVEKFINRKINRPEFEKRILEANFLNAGVRIRE